MVTPDVRNRYWKRPKSLWVAFTVAFAALILPGAGAPISDSDVWWHVRTGHLILNQGIPHHEPWAFTALGRTWVPTAWFSDLVLGLVHTAGGYRAVQVYQVVVAATLLTALAWVLHRRGHPAVAFFVFALGAASLSQFMNGRPQAVSLLLMLWLGCVADGILRGRLPRWWVVVLVTYAWANVHGSWALAPVALTGATLLAVLGRRLARRDGIVLFSAAILGGLSAALTPAGWRLIYWPLQVHTAAHDVEEWQRLNPISASGMFFTVLVLFLIVGWLVRRQSVRPVEVIWTVGCVLLALSAVRNVGPATLLLAPVAVRALTRSWSPSLSRLRAPCVPAWLPLMFLLLAPARIAVTMTTQPAISQTEPLRIVAALKAMPQSHVRVLDDYNIGGFLTGFGAPKISVAIDGRTDNYEPAFIDRYVAATYHLVGWQALLTDLRPDAAVLWHSSGLAQHLQRSLGWKVALTDHGWSLLLPGRYP